MRKKKQDEYNYKVMINGPAENQVTIVEDAYGDKWLVANHVLTLLGQQSGVTFFLDRYIEAFNKTKLRFKSRKQYMLSLEGARKVFLSCPSRYKKEISEAIEQWFEDSVVPIFERDTLEDINETIVPYKSPASEESALASAPGLQEQRLLQIIDDQNARIDRLTSVVEQLTDAFKVGFASRQPAYAQEKKADKLAVPSIEAAAGKQANEEDEVLSLIADEVVEEEWRIPASPTKYAYWINRMVDKMVTKHSGSFGNRVQGAGEIYEILYGKVESTYGVDLTQLADDFRNELQADGHKPLSRRKYKNRPRKITRMTIVNLHSDWLKTMVKAVSQMADNAGVDTDVKGVNMVNIRVTEGLSNRLSA